MSGFLGLLSNVTNDQPGTIDGNGEGVAVRREPGTFGSLDLRTRDASMIHRGLTSKPKWKIPESKRADIIEAMYEALGWAREKEDANAVARLAAVARAMEADNDKVELKREEWARLDAGKLTGRTESSHVGLVAVALANPALRPLAEALARETVAKALEGGADAPVTP